MRSADHSIKNYSFNATSHEEAVPGEKTVPGKQAIPGEQTVLGKQELPGEDEGFNER